MPSILLFLALLCGVPSAQDAERVVVEVTVPDGRSRPVFELGERSTSRSSELRRWLAEAHEARPNASLRLVIGDGVAADDLERVVDRAWTIGYEDVEVAGSGSAAEAVREHAARSKPIRLVAVVVSEGGRIDPRTGGPWSGIGHYGFDDDRRVVIRLGDEDFTHDDRDALLERLEELTRERPAARATVHFGAGVRQAEIEWFRGIPAALRLRQFGTSFERPEDYLWSSADGTMRILDIDFDGHVSWQGETLLEPPTDGREADPYSGVARWLARMVDGLPTRELAPGRRGLAVPVLLRVHPSAPFVHAQRIMTACASARVVVPRVELARAGRPLAEFRRTWLPHTKSEPVDDTLGLTIRVSAPGERLAPAGGGAWSGTGPFVFDADRALEYRFTVDRVSTLEEARALMAEAAGAAGARLRLALDPGPGVTFDEVFSLVEAASELGFAEITFLAPEGEPRDDF